MMQYINWGLPVYLALFFAYSRLTRQLAKHFGTAVLAFITMFFACIIASEAVLPEHPNLRDVLFALALSAFPGIGAAYAGKRVEKREREMSDSFD